VLGCADLLYRRTNDDDSRELAKVIRDQGQLLLGLLNDLLDLSKIEAGRLELHIEPCSVAQLMEDVRSLVQPLAAEKGLALHTAVEAAMPEAVPLDSLRIRQILLNLTTNAIKFTDDGRVSLNFRCDRSSADAEMVIEVRDTGVGIPPERLPDIFQEFYQVERSHLDRGPGAGLGLTIVRKLTELHGGTVAVDSQEGRGTTFTVRLPIGKTEKLSPAAETAPAGETPAVEEPDADGGRLPWRVLIAEDTHGLQFLLRRMLADIVTETVTVGNGAEAVAAIRDSESRGSRFDLVLMDMQMPVLNGFEATEQIRSMGYGGPIVALTAAAMAEDREKCLNVGCTDYLVKPIDRNHLSRALRRHYTC
jgi:CheY-like chemotaxis protein